MDSITAAWPSCVLPGCLNHDPGAVKAVGPPFARSTARIQSLLITSLFLTLLPQLTLSTEHPHLPQEAHSASVARPGGGWG